MHVGYEKLQAYVARAVVQNIDSTTHGLLFRPNRIMRDIILERIGRVSNEREGAALVGSTKDQAYRKQRNLGPSGLMDVEKYIEDDLGDGMIYIQPDYEGAQEPIQFKTPFWEPPSLYANPDSSLNPHLPLIFIPIRALLALRPD